MFVGRDSLRAAVEATVDGYVMEFGVHMGGSINQLAQMFPEHAIWGFDSFKGLPEPWDMGGRHTHPAGHFAVKNLPQVRHNVQLVSGWFNETLEPWLEAHKKNVKFLHIDSDLYSSAKYVLTTLNDRIVPGTIIVFDEMFDFNGNYPNWEEGEWKAYNEWLTEFNREVDMFFREGYSSAVRVLK